jgi:hypothetical protein
LDKSSISAISLRTRHKLARKKSEPYRSIGVFRKPETAKQLSEPAWQTDMQVARLPQPSTPIVYSARSMPPHKAGWSMLLESTVPDAWGQAISNRPRCTATLIALPLFLAEYLGRALAAGHRQRGNKR